MYVIDLYKLYIITPCIKHRIKVDVGVCPCDTSHVFR